MAYFNIEQITALINTIFPLMIMMMVMVMLMKSMSGMFESVSAAV
jgi:hypothetical protein